MGYLFEIVLLLSRCFYKVKCIKSKKLFKVKGFRLEEDQAKETPPSILIFYNNILFVALKIKYYFTFSLSLQQR